MKKILLQTFVVMQEVHKAWLKLIHWKNIHAKEQFMENEEAMKKRKINIYIQCIIGIS